MYVPVEQIMSGSILDSKVPRYLMIRGCGQVIWQPGNSAGLIPRQTTVMGINQQIPEFRPAPPLYLVTRSTLVTPNGSVQ